MRWEEGKRRVEVEEVVLIAAAGKLVLIK